MNKLFLLTLLFSSISFADLDIGEDFEAGDLVSAEEFNNKFGKLKMVLGEVKDADLLGSWDCTSYKLTDDTTSGYFEASTGRLILSESDSESSLTSPKNWLMDTADIIHDDDYVEGTYTLLLNKIYLFIDNLEEDHDQENRGHFANYLINMMNENKMLLNTDLGNQFSPGIVCDRVE
tara:strand:- start:118 stop:648 length:531 start_codon:yes stop_codon:yes gene_type:complete